MTTLEQFNEMIGDIYKTVSPLPIRNIRMKDIMSHKLHVYDEIFGVGVFKWNDKELTSKELFIFKDTPPGTTGREAEGFTEAGFDECLKQIKESLADPSFVKGLEIDPLLKNNLRSTTSFLVRVFADGRAKCKTLEIEKHDQEMKDRAATEAGMGIMFGFIKPPTKYSKFLKKLKTWGDSIVHAKDNDTYKNVIDFKDNIEKKVGSSFSIISWGIFFSNLRTTGLFGKKFGKVPVLLGPCPLKHADYVEIARSGDVLKFRATGSVFLAKQVGGADAIKIEGTLYKAEFLVMFMLWGLFIYGQSKFREMENIPGLKEFDMTKISEVRKLNDLIMTNTSLEKPSYEFHQTFPFVSRHFIIPNCYIETISIEDKLPLKDVLKYTVLLRTYEKPKEVSWVGDSTGRRLYGISNKTMSAKLCEVSLNAGWRMFNAYGWTLDEQEWKIGSAMKEGVMDTYYDVDWSTIATVSYLTLMGAAT